MRRILGIALAVLLIGGVVFAVLAGRGGQGIGGTATKTVRGVIGSEKAEFFDDPDVVEALAGKGWTVETETSGSWAMDQLPLKDYDFAFPGSRAPADAVRAKSPLKVTAARPFYSPLVIVAHSAAAGVLADNGLVRKAGAKSGTLLMDPFLKAVAADRTWQQLKGADAHAELSGSLYISTTDPASSNSGALYLAMTSFVAERQRVVADKAGIDRTAPLLRKLIAPQGAQQTSTDAPFRDFISGVGNPLVLVYESQVASLLQQKQDTGDLVVLYPDTTVPSDHTLVPLTEDGKALGELLSTDKRLRELAVRHGYRPQGALSEFTAATAPHTAYLNQKLTGIRQAPVPTVEVLHEMAARAKGQGGH
ncbi:substrate-binding domain-containing protein [Streptomyces sp. NPDC101118]|uniref:substrate-binding domain-containing protein n=1 Tax=Streptomyces sp. NPDC101118 TaxID=3366109 RepID=UPI00381064B4